MVEAVVESLEVKKAIFRELDAIVARRGRPGHQHLVAVGHRDLAPRTRSPGRVIGVHFFNPAPVQELVEIVRTVVTEDQVVADVTDLVQRLGKNPVVCGDKAGFIANALLFGYLNHAVSMYENRYASREDIDAAMRFGCGYPMGPLALLDLIGLDTAYEILETMYRQGRDRLHAPSPILKQMVTAGLLGRKTGRGFYTYEGAGQPGRASPTTRPRPPTRSRSCGTTSRGSAWSAPGTMATGIVEVFAKAGYDVTYVGRSADKVDGRARGDRAVAGQGDPARQARGVGQGATCSAGSPARPRSTTSRDVDLVVEAIAEDLAVKTTLFANLDEICKPGRDPGDHDLVAAGDLAGQGHLAAAGRGRDALLQPRAGDEAGRGRLDRVDRRRRRRDRPGAVRASSARSRCPAPTGPGSSSTRCCSRTSTTP